MYMRLPSWEDGGWHSKQKEDHIGKTLNINGTPSD